jgi:hypothetical protein
MLYDKKIALALGLVVVLMILASTFGRGVYAQITLGEQAINEFCNQHPNLCHPEQISNEGQLATHIALNHHLQIEEIHKAVITAANTHISNLERNVKSK